MSPCFDSDLPWLCGPQVSGTLPVTPLMPHPAQSNLLAVFHAPSSCQLVRTSLWWQKSAFSQEAFWTFLSCRPKRFVECEFFVGSFTLPGNCQGSKAFQLVGTSHSSHNFSSRLWSIGSNKSRWGPHQRGTVPRTLEKPSKNKAGNMTKKPRAWWSFKTPALCDQDEMTRDPRSFVEHT